MKSTKLQLCLAVGNMMTWGFMCLLLALFTRAVFTPDHQIVITVNQYGEMWIEIPLFTVAFIVSTCHMVRCWKQLMANRKQQQCLYN